jgi:hypothetical protein
MPDGSFGVNHIQVGSRDRIGLAIDRVYAVTPSYAVYFAGGRVRVQRSDDPELACQQEAKISDIAELRAELNALLGGLPVILSAKRRAFEDKLAVALQHALEGRIAAAKVLIENTHHAIIVTLAANQRLIYVSFVGGWFLLFLTVLQLASDVFFVINRQEDNLWLAGKGGLVGAGFSIAIAYRTRQIALGTDIFDNAMDGFLRLGIGVVAGGVAMLALSSGMVPDLQVGSRRLTGESMTWKSVLVVGFVAGFLERLVPSLLDKDWQGLSRLSSEQRSGGSPR